MCLWQKVRNDGKMEETDFANCTTAFSFPPFSINHANTFFPNDTCYLVIGYVLFFLDIIIVTVNLFLFFWIL